MKPDEGDGIVAVEICSDKDDVLLTTGAAQCIRFKVTDVRVFSGRTSSGVRGIRLGEGDEVISMGILRHVDVTPAEARAYLKHASAMRRAIDDDEGDSASDESAASDEDDAALSPERIAELGAAEQLILSITSNGMGKRASAYDYRVTGRGGKGLIAHRINKSQRVVASFPVEDDDQIMLVTDAGQLIRTKVDQIRQAGRSTAGVWVLRTAKDETVVSVERLAEQDEDDEALDTEETEAKSDDSDTPSATPDTE